MDLYEQIKSNSSNTSPKQLIQMLEYYGFVYKRTRGDHDLYVRQGYRCFPVPIKQNPLAVHIVKNALRMIQEIRDLTDI